MFYAYIDWILPSLSEIHKHAAAANKMKSPVENQRKITFFLGKTDELNQDSTEDIATTRPRAHDTLPYKERSRMFYTYQ
jgi:hypothetical protein